MKKETVIPLSIFLIGIFVASAALFLGKKQTKELVSPFSNSFSIFAMLQHHDPPKYTVYGFLPYWNLVDVDYLQMDKLTDISYFGLTINRDGTIKKVLEDGTADPGYNSWINSENLKKLIRTAKYYNVRMAVTVISHEDSESDSFLNCQSCWNTFANELTKEMDSKGIKDVNLNFEYVEFTDDGTADKYTQFTDFINKKLDEKYGDSKVVVSTFADSFIKPRVTKPNDLAKVSDGIFIMAYDFHQPNSDNAGAVAPINGAGKISEYDIQTMLRDYLVNISPDKLIMGVPYYGYNWVVQSAAPNSIRIPGRDDIGFSQSQTYEYVMETILNYKPEIKWDELAESPYFTYVSDQTGSTRQVYFENEKSLKAKYEIIKSKGLAGVGIWALGYDGGYQELWDLLKQEFVI